MRMSLSLLLLRSFNVRRLCSFPGYSFWFLILKQENRPLVVCTGWRKSKALTASEHYYISISSRLITRLRHVMSETSSQSDCPDSIHSQSFSWFQILDSLSTRRDPSFSPFWVSLCHPWSSVYAYRNPLFLVQHLGVGCVTSDAPEPIALFPSLDSTTWWREVQQQQSRQ